MIKVLNLYAGIGGNRKLWIKPNIKQDIEVTAVEINPEIAAIYKDFFPEDEVVVANAHQYLLDHYKEFDFIWSSPPCQSHSRIRYVATKTNKWNSHPSFKPKFADMKLYQEIIFLKSYFEGFWVVENVKGYYEPLIKPQELGRHYYWSNFIIPPHKHTTNGSHNLRQKEKQEIKGFDISEYHIKTMRKDQVLRNCVESKEALYIFNCAFKEKQQVLIGDSK